jgi:hypothetical protein
MKRIKITESELKTLIKQIINEEEDNYTSFDEGLPLFKAGVRKTRKGNLFGLETMDGETIIPTEYSFVDDVVTANGMIMVKDRKGEKKLMQAFLDIDENYITESGSRSDMAKIVYFGFNYPMNFIVDVFGDNNIAKHLENKFNQYYEKHGPNAAFFMFFTALDEENQSKMEEYIRNRK